MGQRHAATPTPSGTDGKSSGHALPQQTAQQHDTHKSNRSHSTQGERAVLKHGRSSLIADIRNVVTTKHNQVFMLTAETGDILSENRGHGIYFRDTCFLDQLEMRLNGQHAIPLLADAAAGRECRFELTNPDINQGHGRTLPKERLSLRRTYSLGREVKQEIALHHLSSEAATLDLTLALASHFTNMFVVRGAEPGKRGTLQPPQVTADSLLFAYDGADGHRRTTTAHFSPAPDSIDQTTARYTLSLSPGDRKTITVTIRLEDHAPGGQHASRPATHSQTSASASTSHRAFDRMLADLPEVTSDNPLFDLALARSLADMRMLATAENGDVFVAAGVPWYVALFGRDSCISAFEMLAFQPELAKSTLEILARYQGTEVDDYRDEEPGKIPHELRVGEKANLHEVPQYPYYGTVDATPWFLMLLGEYVRWTDDFALFEQLRDNVERALNCIEGNPQRHGTEFVAYGSRSEKGLINQGWKDSGNGVVNEDGSLCKPPIALVEVQGYVYAAQRTMATLFRRAGDTKRADTLDRQAGDLKHRFNERYWMDDTGYYAFALQDGGRPSKAIASNPGQLLFTGIASASKTRQVCKRLLQSDMYCGWGIRTLAATETAYNPLDYQLGSVWPHDNALIGLGLRRAGFPQALEQVFTGIFEAANNFTHYRLPEVFDGFSKDDYSRPVRYPVACSPQAWAAGALPLLLTAALGLEPEAPKHLLRIHRPHLPAWLGEVTIRKLRVGGATVDLRYQRHKDMTLVGVLGRTGELSVAIEY